MKTSYEYCKQPSGYGDNYQANELEWNGHWMCGFQKEILAFTDESEFLK